MTAASSERMSPNRFSVTRTSKPAGHFASVIAALSTSRCSSSTSGKSAWTSSVTLRHRRLVARTFALSTWVTFLRRVRASSNARVTIRRISASVYHSVSIAARPSSVVALLRGLAEVQAAGELAEDQAVDALEQLRLERRRVDELRLDGDRAQVRVQPEAAAEREQRLLRADRGVRVVPLRPADRAEQHGVGVTARLDVLGPAGRPVRVDRRAADRELLPREAEPEPGTDRFEDVDRPGDDLRAHPVAGDERDPVRQRRPAAVRRARSGGEAGLRHGSSSAVRRPTNATSMPLISAPWSLLIAVR